MDIEKVKEELEKIKGFKNVNVTHNETKDIYDIYARIKGDEEAEYANTKDILDNIDNLEYQYNDFGIFELWFSTEYVQQIIKDLQKNF